MHVYVLLRSDLNVLLSRRGHIKLADFGLACVLESSEGSARRSKKGTAVYFSPEKEDGVVGYDSKDDMWAAGSTPDPKP